MMQSYQGASKVLYVGNLDRRCTEEFLKQVFGKIAPVERCKMIYDHTGSDPYCFVEFEDHDSARTALETMNGRRVFDQDIKVNWATSNTGMRKDTSSHFHIFVGDLPDQMTTDLLKSSFEKFGKISDARVVVDASTGMSKGYGFVSFYNKINAENAIKDMNGKTLNGKQIRTNWASRKPQPPQVKKLDMNEVVNKTSVYNKTVYVGNLPDQTSSERLSNVFKGYGTIMNIRVLADKGYAFITFDDHYRAAEAICGMHGENLDGNVLKCSWGKEQDGQNSNMHSYFQQQQQQQQYYYGPYYQQQQQQHTQQQMGGPFMHMQTQPGYYYPNPYGHMMQMAHGYPHSGPHMGGQGGPGNGQQGPNGLHNAGPQGGGMGY
ncbi:nucleolysin TIAR-like isoform X2 [Xenia sp. Carnegie-2017]|uniref:nucleolysin TIAR-like isoform X2 n=1 Tax=Xenia sp. Carnegie-2017 TaxID=2897299 RepID=UPI001F0473C6|nr:nucleolysin TIAR-like isoform X2 [Xenia sp. Carnegie-2017]